MKDLQSKYHKSISSAGISKINCEYSHQALLQFYKILKYVGDLWADNCNQTEIFRVAKEVMDPESLSSQQLGERVLDRLSRMGSRTREMFDLMEKNSAKTSVSKAPSASPATPTSVLPETSVCNSNPKDQSNLAYAPPLLRPLRLQAVGNFKPVDGKRFSFHMVPVVVDQNSYSVHQNDQIDTDLKLDFVEAVMSMEPIPGDATVSDGNGNAEGKLSETATIHPHMLHLRQSLYPGNGGGVDNKSKPSEATIPASPPSLPMLRLRAPALQSATPTPPPSPMVLKGLYMSMDQPFAYAMTIDDIDIGTINDICNDNDFRFKPSEATMTPSSPSSLPTSQSSTESKNPPPPSPSVQQANKSTPPAAPLPPPPPLPQSRSAPAPPPPLPTPSKGSAPQPHLLPQAGRGPPPPPPSGAMRALHAKKNTKLKRSSQMGNLYRLLKGKVEGSSLNGRASQQSKRQVGGGSGDGKGQGMADALAEITKRSAYFRQIEEDVEKYATSILELKTAIGSFRSKEMDELKKFHQHVEQQLEKLSDETQVLARFEDFPYKKLETLRMAVALYSKLDGIATTLRNWKVKSPIAQQLDKVECFFNKIKEEMDATDRNKDEESKRFQSHNIEFDFSVLIRIKESMVDLSSNCIEIALKESKESKETAGESSTPRSNGLSKMLWRAFQLAFRVYNFAGGQDDRADRLTSELAREIETFPQF